MIGTYIIWVAVGIFISYCAVTLVWSAFVKDMDGLTEKSNQARKQLLEEDEHFHK